jgi:hypothetical protein
MDMLPLELMLVLFGLHDEFLLDDTGKFRPPIMREIPRLTLGVGILRYYFDTR